MSHKTIAETYRQNRAQYPETFGLRIHRTLSWLHKADTAEDEDTRFIALWIAFNAAYAREMDYGIRAADKGMFVEFLAKICRLDKEQTVYRLVWQTFPSSIRVLLDNHYVFQPFWDHQNGAISQDAWEDDFARAKKRVLAALSAKDTHTILMAVFKRLYTLRNQLLHGGATFNSRVNRQQLHDACRILSTLIPAIVQIMLDHPVEVDWGRPFYPVVT